MQYSDQKIYEPLDFSDEIKNSPEQMAEYFLQYATARDFCNGKRVLDISACAGYGSYLMAEWGAKEVVSICTSSACKSECTERLQKNNIKFISGATEKLTSKLIGEKFDLIVSLSSIQHAADPAELLSEMRGLLNTDGKIIFSFKSSTDCNQSDDSPHLEKHAHHGYKELSESILGKATFWGVGAPIVGYCVIPGDSSIEGDARPAITLAAHNPTLRNPQPTNDPAPAVAISNDTYHFGMWGIENQAHSFIALPASTLTYLRICQQSSQFVKKIEVLEAELARQSAETSSYRTLIESNLQDFPGINSQFLAFNHPTKWERRLQKWKKSIKKRFK